MQSQQQLMLESHGITDIGKRRKRNEDCFRADDSLGLYVVADGMGGHQAGEVASLIVADTIHHHISLSRTPGGCPIPDQDISLGMHANCLRAAILEANSMVKTRAMANNALQGMGSTAAVVLIDERVMVAGNVGDSPIFLVRDGVMHTLSVLHTVAAEQATMTKKLAPHLQEMYGHMLTRAVGTRDVVQPDFFETRPRTGDVLLLCSDGLSEKVRQTEMQAILQTNTPEVACEEMVEMALDRGGEDNITCLVVKIRHAPQDPTPPPPPA